MGLLADAVPFKEHGFLVEPQADLQDLHFDEAQFEEQTQETASCKSERTFAKAGLPQCNLEYGLYARHFGERQKSEKFEYYG